MVILIGALMLIFGIVGIIFSISGSGVFAFVSGVVLILGIFVFSYGMASLGERQAIERCAKHQAEARYVGKSYICITPDGRIVG